MIVEKAYKAAQDAALNLVKNMSISPLIEKKLKTFLIITLLEELIDILLIINISCLKLTKCTKSNLFNKRIRSLTDLK